MEAGLEALKKNLFEVKYDPKEFKHFVLLDRIRKEFPEGKITKDVLLFGNSGTGKSSLMKKLAGKNCLYINSRTSAGVEILKKGSKVHEYCSGWSFEGGQKHVFFDELDGASRDFFDALKGFMDMFKDVIFIGTTNFINEIPKAVLSRFRLIDFDFQNEDEKNKHFLSYASRIKKILKNEGVEASDVSISKLCEMYHPDMRDVLQAIQTIVESGEKILPEENIHRKTIQHSEMYSLITQPLTNGMEKRNEEIHTVVTSKSNPVDIIRSFDGDFFKYISQERPELVSKYGKMVTLIAHHNNMLHNRVDPTLTLKSMIYSLMITANG